MSEVIEQALFRSAAKAILAFLEWRDANTRFFDDGDWQLAYKPCVDCLNACIDKDWAAYTKDCPECEKRAKANVQPFS